MTVLLDTHAFVWALKEPERLSTRARDVISDATVPLLISSATAWELAIKHRSGRWPQVADLLLGYDRAVGQLRARHLPLTSEHALLAGGLSWDHTDPFDRALAAQAIREGVPLVTRDEAFAALPGLTVVW